MENAQSYNQLSQLLAQLDALWEEVADSYEQTESDDIQNCMQEIFRVCRMIELLKADCPRNAAFDMPAPGCAPQMFTRMPECAIVRSQRNLARTNGRDYAVCSLVASDAACTRFYRQSGCCEF
ncbi:MAG: hypothetical protein KDJ29_05405 [Hyphomicrobiales bacterium]|nr:hypothetical protein [Hyphomicrobiales bacterium]